MANGTLAVSQLEILTQSGTGIITVVPPTTNTNRTLTLPDVTATVITDSAGILNIGSGQVYKDASGNLLVGATSIATIGGVGSRFQSASNAATTFQWAGSFINTNATGSYALGVGIKYSASVPNSTAQEFLYCEDTSAVRLKILSNGGIANYSANNTNLSDRLEKMNFAPAGSYLDKICAIPVQTYNYIDQNLEEDDGLTLGVVAQDVQAIAPELVMESNWAGKDEEPKMRLSIYQTDLQYALMKCIQEQQTLITQLQADVAALKSAQA